MFYKPKYCCNCGDRIDRIEWKITASRRFCEVCETEYKLVDWMLRILGMVIILIGVAGLGTYFESVDKPLKIESVAVAPAPVKRHFVDHETGNELKNPESPPTNGKILINRESNIKETNESVYLQKWNVSEDLSNQTKTRTNDSQKITSAPVYFCGAKTKKGRPCSRKVKIGGRCWQHQGLKSMLPPKKLLIKNK